MLSLSNGRTWRHMHSHHLPYRESSSEDQTRPGNNDHSDANMADTTLVPGTVRTEYHRTIASTPNAEFVNVPNRRPSSAVGRPQTNPGSMENFGQNNPSGGMSEAINRLLNQTRRPGSKRTYAPPWEKWISWAERKQVDPLQTTVEDIANVLSSTFESPVGYSTLNCYRSAISAHHTPIEGYKVGQHPLIIDLMRGAFNAKPTQPRYTAIWDAGVVLRYLRIQEPIENLDLKDLTMRLTMTQTQTQTEFYSTSIEIKSVTSGCKNNMVENKR